MKRFLTVGLFFLAFGLIVCLPSPPAQAFTLINTNVCKNDADCTDPDPASKCVESKCNPIAGSSPTVGVCSVFSIACVDTDPNDCLKPQCNPSTGACEPVVDPNCPPPADCKTLYPGDAVKQQCCAKGLSPADPLKWRCCVENPGNPDGEACCNHGFGPSPADKRKCCEEHVSKGLDPGTPADPKPCPPPDCPRCRKCVGPDGFTPLPDPYLKCCISGDWSGCTGTGGNKCVGSDGVTPLPAPYLKCCQTGDWSSCGGGRPCEPPPPLNCGIFTDDETKACCEKFKEVPALAIAKCVKPGECNNSISIVAEAGATVNMSNFNQCCQVVNNPGSMTGVTVSQACNNITTPTTPATPTTPTTPAGSASAAATCSCAPRETTEGTAFAGTPWDCEFQAPSASGPSSLSAAANLSVTTQDPFQVVDAGGGMAKTARLPNTSNKFVVQGPLLTNWRDNPDNAGKVTACTQDAAGSNLACGDCLVATKAQIFGGAGGEGGCSLRRNP